MPKFQVVSPHLLSECQRALDEMLEHDPVLFDESWIGCPVGDHTAYAVVDSDTAEEARNRIPEFIRHKTRVVEVIRPTLDLVKAHREGLI